MGRSMKSGTTDSCGCALSAKFMAVALTASAAYYGWQFGADEVSLAGLALRVGLVTFVAAGIGKVAGILRHRWRGKALFRSAP
jgi:putative Mn2+ efflux pump MntP